MSVIIVGGGMTGATLALAISHLTQGQLPVHLVEAVAPGKITPVLMPAPLRWRREPASSCAHWHLAGDCRLCDGDHTVHVSDRGHAGFVTLDAQDYRIDALGQVVELHDVGLRLFRCYRTRRA
jgi:2-octaprenyl-6-methoxyphenol hydroxylase